MESPTHVGNTRCHRTMRWRTSAHPHACGEYAVRSNTRLSAAGSSPRVWGILVTMKVIHCPQRFIPTRVGNTSRPSCCGPATTVHPHACGEYGCLRKRPSPMSGSSPRVWGIRAEAAGAVNDDRFIPTRVGNTGKRDASAGRMAVHPHACGEYPRAAYARGDYSGSSPRVWGILSIQGKDVSMDRFIPTRVGNTGMAQAPGLGRAVHPHACGEYGRLPVDAMCIDGSSPRVWGIRRESEN